MSTFREDGAAHSSGSPAISNGSASIPCSRRSSRARFGQRFPLAARPAEPFAAVLRDLDAVLMPGVTHWQSPRYFAYFATTAAEPGILAELLIAGLNQVGILWRASPALQELEEVTLDWLRQLLGLPDALHGHLEDTASTGLMTAIAAARSRSARPEGRRVLGAHPLVHRRRRRDCSSSTSDRRPSMTSFRLRPDRSISPTPARSSRRSARRARPRSIRLPRSPTGPRRRESGSTSTPPMPARLRCARSCAIAFAGWDRADSIGVNPHKWLSPRWTARCSSVGGPPTFAVPSASSRSTFGWTRTSSA